MLTATSVVRIRQYPLKTQITTTILMKNVSLSIRGFHLKTIQESLS